MFSGVAGFSDIQCEQNNGHLWQKLWTLKITIIYWISFFLNNLQLFSVENNFFI